MTDISTTKLHTSGGKKLQFSLFSIMQFKFIAGTQYSFNLYFPLWERFFQKELQKSLSARRRKY